MDLKQYQKLRQIYSKLVYTILDTDRRRKENIINAGKILGFWNGKEMVFEFEEEMNVLTEYSLYEQIKGNKSLINIYKEQCSKLDKDENEILYGMSSNYCSLFEIVEINVNKSIIYLKDQITKDIYSLMDLSLSQTAKTEMLIFTRLIPVYKINMTSGLIFQFQKRDRLKLLTELSNQNENTFEIIFRCNKIYGIQVKSNET